MNLTAPKNGAKRLDPKVRDQRFFPCGLLFHKKTRVRAGARSRLLYWF